MPSSSVQRSSLVQGLPSSGQGAPSSRLVWVTPAAALQASAVHALPSSSGIAVPAHVPFAHVSFTVHGSPSSHAPLRGAQAPFEHVPHCPQSTHTLPAEPQLALPDATQLLPLTQASPVQQVLPAAQWPPLHVAPTADGLQLPALQT
jgi:hypothetical protein